MAVVARMKALMVGFLEGSGFFLFFLTNRLNKTEFGILIWNSTKKKKMENKFKEKKD